VADINFYEIHPCPKCKGNSKARLVGDLKDAYIIDCNDCGFIAANYDEARFTLLGAIRLWNKKCGLNKERDSN
jgi:hypothetical protein